MHVVQVFRRKEIRLRDCSSTSNLECKSQHDSNDFVAWRVDRHQTKTCELAPRFHGGRSVGVRYLLDVLFDLPCPCWVETFSTRRLDTSNLLLDPNTAYSTGDDYDTVYCRGRVARSPGKVRKTCPDHTLAVAYVDVCICKWSRYLLDAVSDVTCGGYLDRV